MSVWKKAPAAAIDWCGDVNPKVLYAAVKKGTLKAARIGAGRNLLFCEQWCDEWLIASANQRDTRNADSERAVEQRASQS